MKIRYDIMTPNGCILTGGDVDFLVAIMKARKAKARLLMDMPHSRFRVQMFYPNGRRIPSIELKAALRALSDSTVFALVSTRLAGVALRSGAAPGNGGSAVALDLGFSQASVVAPPDSPDLGNSSIVRVERLGV